MELHVMLLGAPLLLVTLGILAGLGLLAWQPSGRGMARLSQATLIAALLSVPLALQVAPAYLTGLLWVDPYGLLFMLLLLAPAALLLPLVARFQPASREPQGEFYLLFLLATLGGLVLCVSQHAASLFLGLELMSLSLVALIGYPYDAGYRPSLEACVKYLVLSGAASATLLFGLALIYADQGDLAYRALTGEDTSLLLTSGLLLLIAGLGFKLSLVPFHLWTADIYQGANLPVSALLATLSKAAAFILLLRFCIATDALAIPQVAAAIALLSAASMLIGNLLALQQQELKRLLGFSSIAHLGYLLVGLLALPRVGSLGIETLGFYIATYVAATLAAFAVLSLEVGEEEISLRGVPLSRLQGLFWSAPLKAATLTLALLSLAGLPLTMGFIGKFYLLVAALEADLLALALLLVLASGLGLFYYLRILLTL